MRLYIIEDQPAILKSLVKLLKSFPDIDIVGTAMSGETALEEIIRLEPMPQVILCDLGLPKMSGIEATKKIKALYKNIEILIFTVFEDEDKVLEAIKAGASGYLLKDADIKKVHEAIFEVFNGGTVIQPTLARKMLKYFSMPLEGKPNLLEDPNADMRKILTVRELDCLQMIAKGLNNQEAADVLM